MNLTTPNVAAQPERAERIQTMETREHFRGSLCAGDCRKLMLEMLNHQLPQLLPIEGSIPVNMAPDLILFARKEALRRGPCSDHDISDTESQASLPGRDRDSNASILSATLVSNTPEDETFKEIPSWIACAMHPRTSASSPLALSSQGSGFSDVSPT
eukprot:s1962_g6.t1